MAAASRQNAVPQPAHLGTEQKLGLAGLHRQILDCRRCVVAGLLERAAPVLATARRSEIVLVGQAPGRVEEGVGLPFSGRAGRILFRWLAEAGLGDEESARRRIYVTSLTKCFPGPARSGSGDRRPSPAEIELCGGHLRSQLALQRPWLILVVGQMALERFLGPLPMHLAVGRVFRSDSVERRIPAEQPASPSNALVLPLPHPSGASRWLNVAEHRSLLRSALETLRELTEAPPPG
ncbi:MAG TPA: uracil-DNA glycosylase family protein [Candidatus Micrarchaeaceae archaeon]|nr:uracil-DNA glycosylase family protein [Candidatus Micrarchaeaceae archaeon]